MHYRSKATTLEQILLRSQLQPNGCIEWQLKRNSQGYAQATADYKTFKVSRKVCELVYGPPKLGDYAMHLCDNPPCINPDHLRWGTPLQNSQDAMAKNRIAKGERAGGAKLTDFQVLEIRQLYANGSTHRAIASIYGMNHSVIGDICRRETWRHLD